MKNHLQLHWWKYFLALLIPVLLWTGVFSALARPKANERVHILYVGNHLDTLQLQTEITDLLPQLTKQPIKQVTVSAELPSEGQYYSFLEARCFDYDLIIMEESRMKETVGQDVFVRLMEEMTAALPGAIPYREMTEDGELTYGYLLFDGSSPNSFSGHYSGTEKCYVFVSPESVNFHTLNEKGRIGDDAALKVLQYLLEKTQ